MDVYAKMSKFKFSIQKKNTFHKFPESLFCNRCERKFSMRKFQQSPDCWSPEIVSVFLNTLCETVLFHISICTETDFTVFGFSLEKVLIYKKTVIFFVYFFVVDKVI